ncbi:tyrosyl-DNA phosphodiesterase-domain-containing protein [Mucidula mucida]|nr:tyrosyl-DNA phosphodiesterase-domain-containing protein [Mucidula mucida]
MYDDHDAYDDDLAKAIAASLADQSRSKPIQSDDVLVISDDDEPPKRPAAVASTSDASTSNATNSFLSERAQMEKERRERARKFLEAKGPKEDDEDTTSADKDKERRGKARQYRKSVNLDDDDADSDGEVRATQRPPVASTSTPPGEQLFFDGELRPTPVQGGEPRKDRKATFRLTEALGKKSDVSFAILASYAHDISWIHSFFEPSVPVIFITHGQSNKDTDMRYVLPNWIKITPKLGHLGCFHMKFMLIFYKTGRMRVAITTANLCKEDYRDIENLLWLQDIPPRPTALTHDPKYVAKLDDFPSVMQRTLHALGVKEALTITLRDHPRLPISCIEDLRCRWDWSKVKVQLVPSIAGKHEGAKRVNSVGHVRLMKAIRNFGLMRKPGQITLECQGSSVGKYTTAWLNEFYYSALGQSAGDYLDQTKATRNKRPLMGLINIIFPTKATVAASRMGDAGGGTIFCQRGYFDTFKKLQGTNFQLRDSKSKAGNVLMHSKMILAVLQDTQGVDEDSDVEILEADGKKEAKAIAWAYVGSHNFTPSAWGNIQGSAFNPAITISNYEIGIVFPIRSKAELDKVTFWERPAKRYGADDEPWIMQESPAYIGAL